MGTGRARERILAAGWLVSLGVAGVAVLQWRAYVREVEQRAEDAERTRDEVARRRAVEERLRIARELHDSLTHSISVIKVQAGVAAHLARKRGEEPPPALLAIQEASTDAARELRSTLDVLRRDGEPNGNGIDRLEALVERAEAAGVPTTVRLLGVRRALPAETDQAAYRVVQEALTNVARHGGAAAAATVRVAFAARELTLQVDDDGRGAPGEPEPGHGLTGMRERVAALGGTLHAGPGTGGGFSVRVTLPLPAGRARPGAPDDARAADEPAARG
ncbi:sensor histidine kinase [Isoptericola sp. NPDC058082]|uniref:sensor histidine kinase n=1 Tax=Isoptericola sp. NPDC058082 TaxID=3346331 RepID=UPI0036ECFB64